MKKENNKLSGFSLIEISVVVVIVSVIASSSLSLLGKSNKADDTNKTKSKLEFVSRAIQVYRNKNDKLPCPAQYNKYVNNASFGKPVFDESSGNCVDVEAIPNGIAFYAGNSSKANIVGGMIPFVELGIPPHFAFDSWGRRITYLVDQDLTKTSTYSSSIPNIEVRDLSYNDPRNSAEDHSLWRKPKANEVNSSVEDCRDETGATDISPSGSYAVKIPVCVSFALISHGQNGYYGVKSGGQNIVNTTQYGPYEWENALNPDSSGGGGQLLFNDIIINMPEDDVYESDATDGGYFDDIIIYREKDLMDIEASGSGS